VKPLSIAFRVLAGLIMLAAAGRLLFGWRFLERSNPPGPDVAPHRTWAGRQSRAGGIVARSGLASPGAGCPAE